MTRLLIPGSLHYYPFTRFCIFEDSGEVIRLQPEFVNISLMNYPETGRLIVPSGLCPTLKVLPLNRIVVDGTIVRVVFAPGRICTAFYCDHCGERGALMHKFRLREPGSKGSGFLCGSCAWQYAVLTGGIFSGNLNSYVVYPLKVLRIFSSMKRPDVVIRQPLYPREVRVYLRELEYYKKEVYIGGTTESRIKKAGWTTFKEIQEASLDRFWRRMNDLFYLAQKKKGKYDDFNYYTFPDFHRWLEEIRKKRELQERIKKDKERVKLKKLLEKQKPRKSNKRKRKGYHRIRRPKLDNSMDNNNQ